LVVTSQSERQWKLQKSTANSFIIYFEDMSYVKFVKSPQLISTHFSQSRRQTSDITFADKKHTHFVHNMAWWAEEMLALDRNERIFSSSERLTMLVMPRSQKIYSNKTH